MLIRFIAAFAVVALVAFAGSIPVKGPTYHVVISEAAVVGSTTLQPGEYKVTVSADKAVFILDKNTQEVPVKVENGQKKFADNQVLFDTKGAQNFLKQICVGGTKTTLNFN